MPDILRTIRSLSKELRRRRVYRAAALYAAGALATLQVADLLFSALLLPDWVFALLVVLAVVGFPVAVALAWAFQLTSEGLRPEHASDTQPAGAGWAVRGLVLGMALLLSVGVGWSSWAFWLRPGRPAVGAAAAEEEGTHPPALDPARIAVLYFDDHSRDGDLGYLADGLTEALLHELAQVPALEVMSRNAVKAYRAGDLPLDSLVRSLGVGSLVEGSVSRSGDRVRVTVQLVDAGSGAHLDSRVLERPAGELFALQDELTQEVTRALRRRLGTEVRLRQQRRGATSVEAWTLFRRAIDIRDDYESIWRQEPEVGVRGLLRADSLLEEAERLDPRWAQLPVARGWVAHQLSMWRSDIPGALDTLWSERALEHAARAIALRPDGAAGHELRGTLLAGLEQQGVTSPGDGGAEAALRRAVELDPRAARAWSELAEILVRDGRFAEARAAARHALEADAFLEEAPRVMHTLYFAALQEGPEEEARRWCDEGRRRFPEKADFVVCRLFLLASFPQVPPDVDGAWALVDTLAAVVSERDRAAFRRYGTMQVAKVAARAGLADSARAIIRQATGERTPAWLTYDEAHARLLLGERDAAIRLLRQHIAGGADPAFVARDWWFRDLQDDPRFRALVGS